MRILLVSGAYPPMRCGIGDYTAQLAQSLAQIEDVAVAVLTDTAAKATYDRVDLLPTVRTWGLQDIPSILDQMRKWRPDIVHIQYPSHSYGKIQWVLPAIAWIVNGPIVQTWHEYYSPRNWPSLLNAALPGGLVAVRPKYKEKMPGWFRWLIRLKEFRFIPNASSIPHIALTKEERESIRSKLGASGNELVVYFGFVYPAKDLEVIFQVADPFQHRLVLICDLHPHDPYHARILSIASRPEWMGRVNITGFLPAEEAAKFMGAADAIFLPFRDGGGEWNSSIHGAAAQGTFVLTNSHEKQGYDEKMNIYYTLPRDITEMRKALQHYAGYRNLAPSESQRTNWNAIALAHLELYRSLLGKKQ